MLRKLFFICIVSISILLAGCSPSLSVSSLSTRTLTPAPTPTPVRTPLGPRVIVNSESDIFPRPIAYGSAVASLTAGSYVALVERTEDDSWFKIQKQQDNWELGWVPASHLDLTDDSVTANIPVSTPTPIPTNAPPPTQAPDWRMLYAKIDVRELDAYPNKHIGDKVKLEGEVFNITDGGLQMWVRKPGGDRFDTVAVVVTWRSDSILPPQVYEDTLITVYGIARGTFSGTNAFGGTMSQPLVEAEVIQKR